MALPSDWQFKGATQRINFVGSSQTQYRYEGPNSSYPSFLTALNGAYSNIDMDMSPEEWVTATVTYPFVVSNVRDPLDPGVIPSNGRVRLQWELDSDEEDVHVTLTDTAQDLASVGDGDWLRRIAACAQTLRDSVDADKDATIDWTASATYATPPSGATAGQIANAKTLTKILFNDPDATAPVHVYVLRKTQIVVNSSSIAAAHANVGRMMTMAYLAQYEEGLTAASIVAPASIATLYWLKKPPRVLPASGQLWEVTQEWASYASFDDFVYGAALDYP